MYKDLISNNTVCNPNGTCESKSVIYSFTKEFDSKKAMELVKEFTDLAKIKGLTIRQAQQMFLVCADYILDEDLR